MDDLIDSIQPKSKKKSVPISQFQKQCKSYFSSISARGCKYLYLNFPGYENYLILSNADPDLLTTYTLASMISVHVIEPKDDFLETFRNLITPNIKENVPYLIRVELITKAFKDFRIETVFTNINPEGILFVMGGGQFIQVDANDEEVDDYSEEDENSPILDELDRLMIDDGWDAEVKRSLFTKKHIAGTPLTDPFVIMEMEKIIQQIFHDYHQCTDNVETSKIVKFDQIHLVDQVRTHANWYRTISFTGDQLGLPVKFDYRPQKILLIDGLDLPCVAEFLKKKIIKDQFIGEFNIYIYNSVGDTAKCLACYDALDVKIISTRPYLETTLIPRNPERVIRHIHPKEISHE